MSEHHKFRYLLPPGNNFDFVSKFRPGSIISRAGDGRLASASCSSTRRVRGDYMNWTIDFKGGTEIILAFKDKDGNYTKVDPAKVRETLEKAGEDGFEVSDISWARARRQRRRRHRQRHDHPDHPVLGAQARRPRPTA